MDEKARNYRPEVIDFRNKYLRFLDVLKDLSEQKFKNPDIDMTMEIYRFHKIVVNPMDEAYQKLTDKEKEMFIEVIFRRNKNEPIKSN